MTSSVMAVMRRPISLTSSMDTIIIIIIIIYYYYYLY